MNLPEEVMQRCLRSMVTAPRLKPGERAEWAKIALWIAYDEGSPFPLNFPVPEWAVNFLDGIGR